jgi:hypothetical protein
MSSDSKGDSVVRIFAFFLIVLITGWTAEALAQNAITTGAWIEEDDGDTLTIQSNGDANWSSSGSFRIAQGFCGSGGNVIIYSKSGCCYYSRIVQSGQRMIWLLKEKNPDCKKLINFSRP